MNNSGLRTSYGIINPNRLVGYGQGVSVDPNGFWNPVTQEWNANGRKMVWNDKHNSWVISEGPDAPSSASRSTSGQAQISGGGGGYAAPAQQGPSQAQIDLLTGQLGALDTTLSNKNATSRAEYQRAIDSYDGQFKLDKSAYDKNVFNNENTYTGNNQAALLNAANAGTGLRGVLASLGALAGSGGDVVNRLVGLAANSDAGNARQTFEVNADNLGTAWAQAEQDDKQRRIDADATLKNNLLSNEATVLNAKQGIYEKLAGLYGDGTPQANDYLSKAAGLTSKIAKTSKASVAPYAKASSLFSPGDMQQYLAGTQNLNVYASGSSQTPANSPLFGTGRKKDKLAGVA